MKPFATLVLAWLVALPACGRRHDDDRGDAGPTQRDGAVLHDAGARDAGSDAGARDPRLALPNPALIVASGAAAELAVLDPSSLQVVATLPVAAALHPHHLGVARDGTRVLVTALSADFSGGHTMHGSTAPAGNHTLVYELDLERGELAEILDVPVTAHNAAYMPDDRNLVLAMAEHGMIQLYRTSDFVESWAVTTGAGPLEVTPSRDGRSLVVCNSSDDTLSIIDVPLQEERALLDIARGPVGAWLSADGSIWVSSETARSVSLLADDLASVAAVIELDGAPGQAFETPDGRELWVAVEDRAVVAIYDAESQVLLAELTAGDKPHGIAFEPSGARAFVTDEAAGELLVVDVAAREITDRVQLGAGPNGVAWAQRR